VVAYLGYPINGLGAHNQGRWSEGAESFARALSSAAHVKLMHTCQFTFVSITSDSHERLAVRFFSFACGALIFDGVVNGGGLRTLTDLCQ